MNTQKLTFRSCSERILPSGVSSPRAKSIGFIKGGIERNVTYTAVGSIRVPDPALAQKSSSSLRLSVANSSTHSKARSAYTLRTYAFLLSYNTHCLRKQFFAGTRSTATLHPMFFRRESILRLSLPDAEGVKQDRKQLRCNGDQHQQDRINVV